MLSICIEYLPLAKCAPIVLHTTRVSEHVVSRYEHGSSLMKICEYLAEEMCQRSSDLVHYKPQNSAYIYQSPDVYYLPSHLAIILAIIISIIISSFSSSALSLLCNWRGWSPETWFNLGQAEKQFLGLNLRHLPPESQPTYDGKTPLSKASKALKSLGTHTASCSVTT